MAAWSRLNLREAFTHLPPTIGDRKHDFKAIDDTNHYWGDTVGVFRKPARYPARRAAVLGAAVRLWANRIGDLEGVPAPKRGMARRRGVLGPKAGSQPPRD
jgi:hypothetical protein